MKRRTWMQWLWLSVCCMMGAAVGQVQAQDLAPEVMIRQMSADVLDTIRADASLRSGDPRPLGALVDAKIMPNVNFSRMTAGAVGPAWRKATPEQKGQLQAEFKNLLLRTYAGALTQVSDQSIEIKPMRNTPEDNDVVVRTEVKGKGEPIQLDYRLEKTAGQGLGWKIYNMNVMGVWLVDTYRSQFTQEINAKGIDGLIQTLTERNKANLNAATKG